MSLPLKDFRVPIPESVHMWLDVSPAKRTRLLALARPEQSGRDFSLMKAAIVAVLLWCSGRGAHAFAEFSAARLRRFSWFREG